MTSNLPFSSFTTLGLGEDCVQTCFHLCLFLTENWPTSAIVLDSLHSRIQVSSFSSLNPFLHQHSQSSPIISRTKLNYPIPHLSIHPSLTQCPYCSLSIQTSIELSPLQWFTSSLLIPYSKNIVTTFPHHPFEDVLPKSFHKWVSFKMNGCFVAPVSLLHVNINSKTHIALLKLSIPLSLPHSLLVLCPVFLYLKAFTIHL